MPTAGASARARLARLGAPRGPHRPRRPAAHRAPEERHRPQHAAVHREKARQQRADDRRARHRQEFAGQGHAGGLRRSRPAPDRSGQVRPGRPGRHRRAGRGPARALHRVLRRPVLRGRRGRLQGAEVGAGRLGGRLGRQRADLRHVQPPPPHAGIHEREPAGQAPAGRRNPSRRNGRGKISLSERFGLWLSFYPFKQDDYLDIVYHWLRELGCPEQHIEPSRTEALQWTLERGSRSGRVAYHSPATGLPVMSEKSSMSPPA